LEGSISGACSVAGVAYNGDRELKTLVIKRRELETSGDSKLHKRGGISMRILKGALAQL
jgi:hypothetical protein